MGKCSGKKVTFHKSALKSIKKSNDDSTNTTLKPVSLKIKNIKDKAVKKNLKRRKMHLRRDSLKKKLEKGKKADLEKVAQLKREKTVIIGDMQPLLTALLDEEKKSVESFSKITANFSKKKKFSVKKRMKEISDGLAYFQNAMDINK